MLNNPNPRHEKNRHHLVTCIVVLLTVPLYLLLHLLLPSAIVLFSAVVASAAVLAGRTMMIEVGVRRPPSSWEIKLEHHGRSLLRRAFGITFVEDRDRSESEASGGGGCGTGDRSQPSGSKA